MNIFKRFLGGATLAVTSWLTHKLGPEVGAGAAMAIGYVVSHVFHAMPAPADKPTGNP